MYKCTYIHICVAAVLAAMATQAYAWHAPGHDMATCTAVGATEGEMPEFFTKGTDTIAHCSADPDTFTRPIAGKTLHDAEAPEHYFDVEVLPGVILPPSRYDFLEIVYGKKLKPASVGLLPYAVTEWTQRLTVALAEHRKWPDNPAIRQKCLVYAGLLSHYAEDLCQPLHTTIHHDGRAKPDGSSPKTGIHSKVDALIGKLHAPAKEVAAQIKPAACDDVFAAVLAEIDASHKLVDRVYELEKDLPAYEQPIAADSPAQAFATDRLKETARFTASLYLTAWKDSQKVKFPDWHQRPPVAPDRTPATAPGK
jgi:hypothetical protein